MKKFLFLGAMAAMLLGTASCSNDMEPEMTDGTVQFKVELPGAIDSRAISDGTTATKLDVACYDADGNKLAVEPTVKTDFVNREATVTYKLVKGQTYNFAFFAHAEGAPYTFSAGTKLSECTFTVDNYTGACNDESRDAFYGILEGYSVTPDVTEVTLTRPFAQLNFGADDLAAAQAAGIIPSQSMVTVSKAATTFNLKSGEASGEAAVAFTLADLPSDPTTLTVEGTDYRWMEMCYFLVPGNEANVDVKMTVKTNKANVEVPVTNVPVKKNHRTNIVGSLFTQDANFKVIIDQNFDTPDNNVNYPEITDVAIVNGQQYETLDAAIIAADAGATITLTPGTYTLTTLHNKSVKIVGKNKERSIVECINQVPSNASASVDVYFENLTLKVGSANYKGFQHSNSETYKNIILEGGHLTLYAPTVNFDGCTFNQSTYDYCFWTYGATTTNVTNCVFNTVGKAVKVYKESDTAIHTFNISNSTFNVTSRGNGTIKAAIEIDGRLCPFAVNITNTTVNGHDPGETSGNTLWNCDAGSKATVVVDGETVYQQN
ncbi:MAG: hypothetical protein IJG81_07865 [Muribaculaceae bacterium]|nr:hypothetical protein [Muribaculaceae bacterium]